MPIIDVWAVITDPDIPRDVGQRLLARQAAHRQRLTPEPCPDADKPYLARHVIRQCAAHDELIRQCDGGQWAHFADGQLCPPRAEPDEELTP
ncbi:hypothetical protein [Sphaerimonospora thailandensis]|uniref:Uncharacterized protein n=1 Tax=Sphaerimonospora thailandensis TaxID=795644 RepID=A0A8J3R5H2_9ACTN|nr:hypothetical protein [Sphaerimonospora thailandensis]GIH69457.1 hypothetical protein Mth01_17100 [Sphaerimonospora thailandensis]